MRRAMNSWAFRIGALLLLGILLYGTSYLLLPRTADSLVVTVRQYATVQYSQDSTAGDLPGTTLFRRTFTDERTVSAVRAVLDGMHYYAPGPFTNVQCNVDWQSSRVYIVDLLWHGTVVKSYVAQVYMGGRCYWNVTTLGTLGVLQLATEGPTTWTDLLHLTGMPDARDSVP